MCVLVKSSLHVDAERQTIRQSERIAGTREARVNIFHAVWEARSSRRRLKEAANERKGTEKGKKKKKTRHLWPSAAVRTKAILSSVRLLSLPCVCVLPSFSIGSRSFRHFSCLMDNKDCREPKIAAPNEKHGVSDPRPNPRPSRPPEA